MIITIDGPAGSGKSTIARKLAAQLGIPYVDTGAMYRVVTLFALKSHVDLHDEHALAAAAQQARFELDCGPTHVRVTLDGHDVSEEIRSLLVAQNTPYIAASPGVRRVLVAQQRAIGARLGSMVTEGRDQGSVVFPQADAKFYLDAEVHKRAERRYHEMQADGIDVPFEQVLANLMERDRTDSQRPVAPLRQPDDAVRIDTTHMTLQQVLDDLLRRLHERGLQPRQVAHRE